VVAEELKVVVKAEVDKALRDMGKLDSSLSNTGKSAQGMGLKTAAMGAAIAAAAVVVRQADAFVTAAREALEKFASAPRGRRGLVILEVKSSPATTRLAKAALAQGLVIETAIPPRHNTAGWVRQWAETGHGVKLAAATAEQLLERLGGHLGQVDQALARIAAARRSGEAVFGRKPDAPTAMQRSTVGESLIADMTSTGIPGNRFRSVSSPDVATVSGRCRSRTTRSQPASVAAASASAPVVT
jgi:hypothetical protein